MIPSTRLIPSNETLSSRPRGLLRSQAINQSQLLLCLLSTKMSTQMDNKDASSSSSVIILGDAFADLQCFLDGDLPKQAGGDTRLTKPISTIAGGSGINTATHLKSISNITNVCLYTAINESDEYGALLHNHAKQHEFSLVNCCPETESSTGHCAVMVANGERSFMTHLGVMDTFEAKDVPVDSIVTGHPLSSLVHIHVAGYFNIPGFWGRDQLQKVLFEIKERVKCPTIISLLPQYDATEQWDGQLMELLPSIDYLFVNKLEAMNIAKARKSNDTELFDSTDENQFLEAIAAFFYQQSPSTCIVVTLGAEGACAFWEGKVVAKQPTPISLESPLDPTGAGDSFIAGFLHGILSHSTVQSKKDPESLASGLLYGCVLGTSCVMRSGASNPATQEEINDILYEYEKRKKT